MGQLFPVQTVVGSSKQPKNKDAKRIGQGFVASVAGQETIDDDPLGQQIHNLKQFIKQAKTAGKFDDARILENNLKELQEEHKRQTTELQQNYEEFKDLFSRPPAAAATPAEDNTSTSEELDESNPFFDAEEEQLDENNPFNDEVEDEDQYDKSGKN